MPKITVCRVSNKASHDYAEILDGVPSQHDGKDAAVIAELAGRARVPAVGIRGESEWDQELTYWVEWMVAHRQALTNWQGRLEGLVSRHWPEATRVLKLQLGDAATCSSSIMGIPKPGGGPGCRRAVVPLGGSVSSTGESRAVGTGGAVERGCASWGMAAAPDQRVRP